MKTRWLDRKISAPGPYLAMCLSEEEFCAAVKHIKADTGIAWIKSVQADATAHMFTSQHGLTVIVCIQGWEGRNPVEIAGLLVHEAVHVWQEYASHIGEDKPGREQEAYGIQAIAQELMAEFARRLEVV